MAERSEGAAPTRRPLVLSWSGGKDSALALDALRRGRRWEVAELLTTITEEFDRITMHGVRRELLERQTAALELPLRTVSLPTAPSTAQYEARMSSEMAAARGRGLRHIAFGDLFLEDVRNYREAALRPTGMTAIFPLWHLPTAALARRFVREGYRAILTCVDTTQLDASFAGRSFDLDLLEDLPEGVDPCGENGEFHTFVHDGPIFREPLAVSVGDRVARDDRFVYCDLR